MKEGAYIEVKRKTVTPFEYHGAMLTSLFYTQVSYYTKGKRIWTEKAGNPTICRKYADEEGSKMLHELFVLNKI